MSETEKLARSVNRTLSSLDYVGAKALDGVWTLIFIALWFLFLAQFMHTPGQPTDKKPVATETDHGWELAPSGGANSH